MHVFNNKRGVKKNGSTYILNARLESTIIVSTIITEFKHLHRKYICKKKQIINRTRSEYGYNFLMLKFI